MIAATATAYQTRFTGWIASVRSHRMTENKAFTGIGVHFTERNIVLKIESC